MSPRMSRMTNTFSDFICALDSVAHIRHLCNSKYPEKLDLGCRELSAVTLNNGQPAVLTVLFDVSGAAVAAKLRNRDTGEAEVFNP